MQRPGLFRAAALAAAAVLALAGVTPAPSAAPAGSPTPAGGMQMNGYTIETETTNWNLNSGEFTMPKEVHVTRVGSDARGDRATGNSKRGTATLDGNVVIHDDGGAPEAREVGQDYQGSATITADVVTIDSKQRIYDAQGNVHFSQGNRTGQARRGILNQTAHTLHLEGNVLLTEGEASVRAAVVDYNLQTRDVKASGGPMIIRQPVANGSPPPATPKPAPSKK